MGASSPKLEAIEEQIAHVLEYMQALEPVALRMSQRPGRTFDEAEDLRTIRECIGHARAARELLSKLWHTTKDNGGHA